MALLATGSRPHRFGARSVDACTTFDLYVRVEVAPQQDSSSIVVHRICARRFGGTTRVCHVTPVRVGLLDDSHRRLDAHRRSDRGETAHRAGGNDGRGGELTVRSCAGPDAGL